MEQVNVTLADWGFREKPFYIAVSKHGFGVDRVPAMAIRLAQTEVPANARRSQLLVYESLDFIEPIGWRGGPVWPNGAQPRMVGLTTTHCGFKQSLR
jgi:hypothetical protein